MPQNYKPPEEFDTIYQVADHLKIELQKNKDKYQTIAIYAYNATGKTRLSNIISEQNIDSEEGDETVKVFCYNSHFEDIFVWDNENLILKFDTNNRLIQLVIEQGLENNIVDNFKELVSNNIEPNFDYNSGVVTFVIASGDDNNDTNIKISRGEERMVVWSFFYTIMEQAIAALNDDEENRTTNIFDNLEYLIIDDPISSIDDTKIIKMAVNLTQLIQSCKSPIKTLITTHHPLFYNVIVNALNLKSGKSNALLLSKENYRFVITGQGDSPFAYHLTLYKVIKQAIDTEKIEKYHYNLFRNLLEKTANFLGYNLWSDCLDNDNRNEFTRILNLYSHSKISDLEAKKISNEDKNLFTNVFNNFIEKYNFKI
jgi:hypothetical protein